MSRQSIFITGAAAGIGQATARLFAARGWFVGLYDVDEAGVRALSRELGEDFTCAGRLDVTDPDGWEHALAEFAARAGRLDVLLNNAGILASGPLESIPLARQHLLIDVNIKGVLNGCYLSLPYLQRTPHSRVINLCSASALYGQTSLAVYSATKFAVRGLTEALDLEWSEYGIRVMDVLPLFVATDMVTNMNANSFRKMGAKLTAQDVADTILKAARYDSKIPKVHWTVGFQTRAFYSLSGAAPDLITRFINSRITGSH